MNFYYSMMSIYGWWNWSQKKGNDVVIPISRTNRIEKFTGILMFVVTMIVTFLVYLMFDYTIEVPNIIDIITSGIFFTAMWYMANKKNRKLDAMDNCKYYHCPTLCISWARNALNAIYHFYNFSNSRI